MTATVADAAEIFDCSERRVHQLVRKGLLSEPIARGIYLLGASVGQYIQHLDDERVERGR